MESKKKIKNVQMMHSQVISMIESVDHAVSRLISAIDKFQSMQGSIRDADIPETFDADERIKLDRFNLRLAEVEEMTQQVIDLRDEEAKVLMADPKNRLHDIDIGATATLYLRSDDPAYSIKSDNVIGTRDIVHMPRADRETNGEIDFAESHMQSAKLVTRPHCYLFHDFTDHGYGADRPKIKLADCLRAGAVMVDITVTYQYWVDIDTGDCHSMGDLGQNVDHTAATLRK